MDLGWRINKILKILLTIIIGLAVIIFATTMYFTIKYPISYQNIIDKYSKQFDVDPYLISAIINVESRYDKDAISHKEARGLMQISSSTGPWGAQALSMDDFQLEMLFDPDTNIRIGTWYLDMLSKEFGDNLQLILAAYNGGSGNVSKWLKDPQYSNDGKTLDRIPFEETKDYVYKVSKNYNIYKILYKDKFDNRTTEKESRTIIVVHSFKRLFQTLIKYK